MTEEVEMPQDRIDSFEPVETINESLSELTKKIDFYWKAIDNSNNYKDYNEAWEKLSFYRDLKQKLYK